MSTAHESGDRAAFLHTLHARLAGAIPTNRVHRPPAPAAVPPDLRFRPLDATSPVDTFAAIATDQNMVVSEVHGPEVPAELLAAIVDEHTIGSVVLSSEPEAAALRAPLEATGCKVEESSVDAATSADLGVTSAVAAIAATGSLVLDCRVAGSRTVGLLPRVHLCVLPAGRVVRAPADVFHPLSRHAGSPGAMASNLVLVSGPSRTGDIEQLLTIGVHGPVAVHVILLHTTA